MTREQLQTLIDRAVDARAAVASLAVRLGVAEAAAVAAGPASIFLCARTVTDEAYDQLADVVDLLTNLAADHP